MAQDTTLGGQLTHRVIGLALRVHRRLGPGLLEFVYEKCLCQELSHAGIPFRRQVSLDSPYGDVTLESGLVADLIVDNRPVLELKALERLLPLHDAQLLT